MNAMSLMTQRAAVRAPAGTVEASAAGLSAKDPAHNRTTRRNRMRLASLTAAAGGMALVFVAPMAAQATSFNSVMTASTPLRICANTSSTCNNPQGLRVTSGEHVQMQCWEDSQWYDGTNRWFIVMAPNANMGWVSADMVANQTTVGHC